MEEAGVFSIVLECAPSPLAQVISESISMPTIGIGAGPDCDGQVLVTHDLLGMFEKFVPSFVKTYTNLAPIIKDNINKYNEEVRNGSFPDEEHSFGSKEDFRAMMKEL